MRSELNSVPFRTKLNKLSRVSAMRTINIHEAKTHLSRLVERAVTQGEAFVIAKAGKPMVKVEPVERREGPKPRIGFMEGRISVPADFDERDAGEIEALFDGKS
jgi:prevent-host-death family protein